MYAGTDTETKLHEGWSRLVYYGDVLNAHIYYVPFSAARNVNHMDKSNLDCSFWSEKTLYIFIVDLNIECNPLAVHFCCSVANEWKIQVFLSVPQPKAKWEERIKLDACSNESFFLENMWLRNIDNTEWNDVKLAEIVSIFFF